MKVPTRFSLLTIVLGSLAVASLGLLVSHHGAWAELPIETPVDAKFDYKIPYDIDWNSETVRAGKPPSRVYMLHPPDAGVVWAGYSSDGRRVITGATDGHVRIFDKTSGTLKASFNANVKDIQYILQSNDGKLMKIKSVGTTTFYQQRRPDEWWGYVYLWEFWVAFAWWAAFIVSFQLDRVRFKPRDPMLAH